MRTKFGAVLFALGIMTADSEWLVVPVILVGIGMWMLKGLVTR